MKKGIAIALLFVFTLLCFGFTGCSKGQNNQITEPTIATTTVSDNNTTTPADEQKEEMSNRTGNKENAPASLSLESWVGDYMFSEHADPDENMFYSITVYKQDTVYYAQISIDGFQTLKRLQAKAYGDENRIKFTFDKYLQDNVQEPYKKGDTLLSLEKTNSAILTTWGKIQPMLESNAKSHKTCFSKEQLNKSSETNSNKTETWTFGVKDLYIDGKPFLGQTYDRILKNFGQYENYSTYKVRPPATEEGTYNYFGVLQYNDMEFEFALGEEERNLTSSDEVFRFDITGSNVELACGLKVGMTTDEVISKFGPRDIYNLNGNDNSFELSAIKHVLKSYKPVGYYSGYSKGMIIYFDPEKFDDMLAKTVVLLIKDDKVDRIVFGYPTAD